MNSFDKPDPRLRGLNGAFEPKAVGAIKFDAISSVRAFFEVNMFRPALSDTAVSMFEDQMFRLLMESTDDVYNQIAAEQEVPGIMHLKWHTEPDGRIVNSN